VELVRIDIITKVLMISTFLCISREGHLDAMYHLFAYLSLHHNARVEFDPTYYDFDMRAFIKTDWKPTYRDVRFCHLSKYGAHCVVLQETAYCGVKCVWRWSFYNEETYGNHARSQLQVEDDGGIY
jgi:hypothetical protein